MACEHTTPEVGDPTAVTDLLEKIEAPLETLIGYGSYDSEAVSQAVVTHLKFIRAQNCDSAAQDSSADSQRDDHIREIKAHGRIDWKRNTSYGLRAHAELAMQRYKRIIAASMKARAFPQNKTEAWVSASALNTITNIGMSLPVKI